MSETGTDASRAAGTAGGREGAGEDAAEQTVRFSVPEMDCPSCAGKVEHALADVEGVLDIDTRPTTGLAVVRYDESVVDRATLVAAIESAGYAVPDAEADEDAADGSILRSSRGVKTAISGLFLAAGLLVAFLLPALDTTVATVLGTPHSVADVLFLVGIAAGGQVILRGGYYSARNRSLDMDFLMSAAIVGAVTASLVFAEPLYLEAATLAFLVNVAELLEQHSMDRARTSLEELMDLSPDEATVLRRGEEVTVPVEDVLVGDRVVVRPGEKIPVDGEVVDGESAVNQSPVTGESVPVDKTPGDEVYAGTINEGGYLEVATTAIAGEDTLSRVIELVEDAEAEKTEREQFVDRFADRYTPLVVGFAILVTLVSPAVFGVSWSTAVLHGLTLLVLACPCAFVISTPVSVVSGITSAAKNGVLVKGGTHLEAMGEVEAVALDKTGTLTKGELTVTDVIPVNGNTEEEVLQCARGLETRSEHPIGEAIVEHADGRAVAAGEVSEFESITGKGVQATLGETPHYAGKPGLFEDLGFDLSHVHAATEGGAVTARSRDLCERNDCMDLVDETIPALQSEGKTVVLVGTENELEGVIAVADEIRPGAREAVQALRALGIEEVVMLTGDNERTARAIAEQVGVDDFRAELLPEEKVEAVRELEAEHDGVAMVGDGINDAPALATATVGIAMGAAGTDTALETADIALLGDDLAKLPYLRRLAMRATSVIRQNVWSSLGAKALLAVLVPFGLVPIWVAVLVGDAGMTVGVTGNAMRLSRIVPTESVS
ncbi:MULTISPECIES: heavy metal translocating P-type ATPase [Salinibaculum]|uniref:heavy metal translocating P-type ATPase n=1 Tax=Salinibaculum TaxID=2732368 RepID=UPI0030CBF27E